MRQGQRTNVAKFGETGEGQKGMGAAGRREAVGHAFSVKPRWMSNSGKRRGSQGRWRTGGNAGDRALRGRGSKPEKGAPAKIRGTGRSAYRGREGGAASRSELARKGVNGSSDPGRAMSKKRARNQWPRGAAECREVAVRL